MTYARTNARFVLQVEKVFAEFVQGSSEKKVLPSMGSGEIGRGRRGVVVEVCTIFSGHIRLGTDSLFELIARKRISNVYSTC
jgi:hypothetical protein